MKTLFPKVALLAIFLCSGLVSAPARDFGKFLEEKSFRLIRSVVKDHGDVHYLADANWAPYELIVPHSTTQVHEYLALDQLGEAYGLPVTPVWPMVLGRERGDWVVGILRPIAPLEIDHFDRDDTLASEEAGTLLSEFAFAYLTGCGEIDLPVIFHGHVTHSTPAMPFADFIVENPFPNFRAMMKAWAQTSPSFSLVPVLRKVANLSPDEIRKFQYQINSFLNRVEGSVAEESDPFVGRILKSAIRLNPSPKRHKFMAGVVQRSKNLREEVLAMLRSVDSRLAENFPKAWPMKAEPRFFDLDAPVRMFSEAVPEFYDGWEYRAKDFLFNYLLSEPVVQEKMVREWSVALGTDNPIKVIRLKATEFDNRVFLTTRDSHEEAVRHNDSRYFQFQVARSNRRTLVVVSPNDPEAREIISVVHEVTADRALEQQGRVVLYPNLRLYRQGESLTDEDFEAILTYAVDNHFENLLLCELGGLSEERESEAKRRGLKLAIGLDHHNRLNKLSALEQFADFLGYHLSYRQFIVAILDRAGIPGLHAMGLTKEEVAEVLRYSGGLAEIERILSQSWAQHPDPSTLYRIDEGDGTLGVYSRPIGFLHYPNVPYLLIGNVSSVRFAGPHSLVKQVKSAMDPKYAGQWIEGGDLRQGYFIFRPAASEKRKRTMSEIVDDFEAKIRELTPLNCSLAIAGSQF